MAIAGWLTIISWIFIGLVLMSAAAIVGDIYVLGYREHVKIMEAVWPLTALYAGPAPWQRISAGAGRCRAGE